MRILDFLWRLLGRRNLKESRPRGRLIVAQVRAGIFTLKYLQGQEEVARAAVFSWRDNWGLDQETADVMLEQIECLR